MCCQSEHYMYFLSKINTKIRAGKIAPWVKHFPPKCKDLSLDPQDHIKLGMVVRIHTQEQDGSRRQESHQEITGQLAWHTQQWTVRDSVSSKAEVRDQELKLSSDFYVCAVACVNLYSHVCTHINTHPHICTEMKTKTILQKYPNLPFRELFHELLKWFQSYHFIIVCGYVCTEHSTRVRSEENLADVVFSL